VLTFMPERIEHINRALLEDPSALNEFDDADRLHGQVF